MSYNAGSIDSKLTLDRRPFSTELRAAKAEAQAFARNPITVRLDLDRRRADAELRAFEGRVAIATRPRTTRIDIDTRTADQRLRDLQNRINGVPQATRRASQDSQKQLGLLRTAIEVLGPPLVPLAGGLLGLAAGAVGFGIAGVAAFKAVQAEIKAGTPLGAQYAAGLDEIKASAKGLEDQLARAALPGFNQAISDARTRIPGLNSLLDQSGSILGDTVAHGLDGVLGGLRTFQPLILEAERDFNKFAVGFDKWANGPGAARFGAGLQKDLELALPALAQLGTLVSHLVQGLNPAGSVALTTITTIARALNALPVPLLQAAVTAYIAFRTAVAITAPLNLASAALTRFAAAETEAAAAAGAAGAGGGAAAGRGLRGALAGGAAAITPYVAGLVATAVALNFVARATDSWATSTDKAKFTVGNALKAFDSAPWNLPGIWQGNLDKVTKIQALQTGFSANPTEGFVTPRGSSYAAFEAKRPALNRDIAKTQALVNRLDSDYFKLTASGAKVLGDLNIQRDTARLRLKADLQQVKDQTKAYTDEQSAYFKYTQAQARGNTTNLGLAYRGSAGQGLEAASAALSKYQNSLQKNIDAEAKWTDTTKGATVTVEGLKVPIGAADAALKQANGNHAIAIGILKGHAGALLLDKQALAESLLEQDRINGAVGAAQTRYKLTTTEVDHYAAALGISAEMLGRGTVTQWQFVNAVGQVKTAVDNGNTALQAWVAAAAAFDQAGNNVVSRSQLIAAALVSFNGDAISYGNVMVQAATANQQLVTDLGNLKSGVLNLKTGFIDYHNAAAAPVLGDLAQLQSAASNAAAATYQHEVSLVGAKRAAKDAADVFKNDTTVALEKQFQQLGYTKGEADALADRYFKWPKDAKTQIEALGAKDTNTILNAIGQQLAILTGSPWTLNVDAKLSPTAAKLLNSGKNVVFTGDGRGTSGQATAMGGIYDAYAAGGIERHWPQIAIPGANRARVWAEPETGGEAYIPLANDWRRTRAKQITQETAKRLGGAAYFESGGFTGVNITGGPNNLGATSTAGGTGAGVGTKWYYYDGLYYQGEQALNEAKAAHAARYSYLTKAGSGKTAGYGYAGQGYASYQEAHNARVGVLSPLAGQAGGELSALAGLAHRASSTISASIAKITATLAAARAAKVVPDSLVTQYGKDNERLSKALADRVALGTKISAAKQQLAQDTQARTDYGNQVRDTLLGQFDIGTSGNGYALGIKESLQQALANTTKFSALRAKAQQLGLDPRLIQQLEGEGAQGAANLQALVTQGSKDQGFIGGINEDYAKLYAASTAEGIQAAKDNVDLNKQIAADNAEILKYQRAQAKDSAVIADTIGAIKGLVKTMERDLADSLAAARKHA